MIAARAIIGVVITFGHIQKYVYAQFDKSELTPFLISEDAPRSWIHCGRFGSWAGHPAGEVNFDEDTFKAMVTNFEAPRALTYEHPAYSADGRPIPSAGWIHSLELRDDGLWAEIEFTEEAAGYVRDGSYRFCSMVVDFEHVDRKSGEEIGPYLFEIGLTNQPFIDGLRPIKLSQLRSFSMDKAMITAMVTAVLDELPDEAEMDEFLDALQAKLAEDKAPVGDKKEPVGDKKMSEDSEDAEEAKLSDESEDADKAEMSEEPTDEEAKMADESGDDAESAELVEEEPDSEEYIEMLRSLGAVIEEVSGMDLPGALAVLDRNKDKLAAMFDESAEEGAPSDDAAAAGLNAAMARIEALELSLADKQGEVEKLQSEIKAFSLTALEKEIDVAIADKRIKPEQRDVMIKFGQIDVDSMRKLLGAPAPSSKQAKTLEPPQGRAYAPKTSGLGDDIAKFSEKDVRKRVAFLEGFAHNRKLSRAQLLEKARNDLRIVAQEEE